MTSHQVAIAKASFSAGLLRPDPTSVSRDEITRFHDALGAVLSRCSPANIQICKTWILQNIIESPARVGALGKYLAALSTSFVTQEQNFSASREASKTSSKRKRLHILYLLNDLLHHAKYHLDQASPFATLSGSLQAYLVELFALAAGFDSERNPKLFGRLKQLLDIWGSNGYYGPTFIDKLRQTVTNPEIQDVLGVQPAGGNITDETGKRALLRDAPYVMPATHGDTGAPYHELPAGNLLPHIIPNSSIPIKPQSVKALQFVAGPADAPLVNAVKSLLEDVDRIYGSNDGVTDGMSDFDIDELGQSITRDQSMGELDGDAYYGWTRAFCQQMLAKRDGKSHDANYSWAREQSLASSRSRSRSRSYSPIRRRRHYDDQSIDDRRRSRSPGSPDSRGYRRRSFSSKSPSPSRSRSIPRRGRRSSVKSRSYSPPVPPQHQFPNKHLYNQFPQAPVVPGAAPFGVPPPFNPQIGQGASPSQSMFVPPPRPANYHGPWPPPPPPLPHLQGQPNFPMAFTPNMNMNMNPNMPGFPHPPFVPPIPNVPFMPPQQGQMPNPVQGPHGAFPFPHPHPGPPGSHGYHGNDNPMDGGQNGGSTSGGPGGRGGGGWSQGGWT